MRNLRSVMRSAVFLFPLLAACGPPGAAERLGKADQRFTSGEAVLYDFEFDGSVLAGAPGTFDAQQLIQTQLMYTVGQLYAERAVGRFERLEISNIVVRPLILDRSEISYHAKLPVAWAGGALSTAYTFTVPSRVGDTDQISFYQRYGKSCAAEETGAVFPGTMFLYYRPHEEGCMFIPSDVVSTTASVAPSEENTTGKYPEYDRIWEDDALEAVMMFSRSQEDTNLADEGSDAYDDFVRRMGDYLRSLQPNDAERALTVTTGAAPTTRFRARLADGRMVAVDAMLVASELSQTAGFDDWYDALTPAADLVFYNGHAGLGENVRTLLGKGSFRPRQYLIWGANGCDTLAYVNRTLADRRAQLNPDDPLGTKYMDTISNVMAGYFSETPVTSMTLIEALVAGGGRSAAGERTAKTYQEIFASVDSEQVIAVTGEEDNEFQPESISSAAVHLGKARITAPLLPSGAGSVSDPRDATETGGASDPIATSDDDGSGCSAGGRPRDGRSDAVLFAVSGLVLVAARRRFRVNAVTDCAES